MKYYETMFQKKDGTPRTIKYITTEQMTLLTDKQKEMYGVVFKDTTPRNLQEGSKLVFDIEAKQFRVVNFNSLLSEITELEVTDED